MTTSVPLWLSIIYALTTAAIAFAFNIGLRQLDFRRRRLAIRAQLRALVEFMDEIVHGDPIDRPAEALKAVNARLAALIFTTDALLILKRSELDLACRLPAQSTSGVALLPEAARSRARLDNLEDAMDMKRLTDAGVEEMAGLQYDYKALVARIRSLQESAIDSVNALASATGAKVGTSSRQVFRRKTEP